MAVLLFLTSAAWLAHQLITGFCCRLPEMGTLKANRLLSVPVKACSLARACSTELWRLMVRVRCQPSAQHGSRGTLSGPGQRLEDRQGGQDITEHDSDGPLCCLCPYRRRPGQRARRVDLVIQFSKRMWRWRPDVFAPNRANSSWLLSTQYREVGIAYFVHLGQFLPAHQSSPRERFSPGRVRSPKVLR